VNGILDRAQSEEFLKSVDAFARRLALLGALNTLSQLVLKVTMPGVPDFYQGTEFFDLSLVDPDNRRPVDYDLRRNMLSSGARPDWRALVDQWTDGRLKFALMQRLLDLRRQLPKVFRDGSYQPIEVEGRDREHVIAYTRQHGDDGVIVVAGRHFDEATSQGAHWLKVNWQAELKPPQNQRIVADTLGTCEGAPTSLAISEMFGMLPVAVLQTRWNK
jgi:(1->4)-alpha-D-glucan 1-alpha-D-glucosylmutase